MANKKVDKVLEDETLSYADINQYLKCKEKGLVVPPNAVGAQLLRNFLEVCKAGNYEFNYAQQQLIFDGLTFGLPVKTVMTYANPKNDKFTMEQMLLAFKKGKDISKWVDRLEKIASRNMLAHVRVMAINGVSDEGIDFFVDSYEKIYNGPNYFSYILFELRFCLEDNVPISELKKIKTFTKENLRELRKAYEEKNK